MGNYENKTCPLCRTQFKEGDEIKVCDACGIPHHLECWDENRGCTTFGCSQCNSQLKNTCINCGSELSDNQNFCTICGQKTNTYYYDNAESQQLLSPKPNKIKHGRFINAVGKTVFFKKKKNRIITFSCFAFVILIALSLCFGGSLFFSVAFDLGKFDAARQIKETYSNNNFVKENIYSFLWAHIEKSYNKYNSGKITIEDARQNYADVAKFIDVSFKITALDKLEKSKAAFAEGENYLSNSDYLNAFSEFENVIPKDKNYDDAKEKIESNKANLLEQTLEKLTEYENSGDFTSGLELIENANKYLSDNADIPAKKEVFRQQALNQLSQYESDNDYEKGLSLIEDLSEVFPGDEDISAKKTTFEAIKEEARIEELKNSQQITVVNAYTFDDGYYSSYEHKHIIFREARVIVKNNTDKVVENYTVGILTFRWDGTPIDIEYNQVKGNLRFGTVKNISIAPGELYSEYSYWYIPDYALDVKACVIRAEFTDGTVWENEYADYWYDRNKDSY